MRFIYYILFIVTVVLSPVYSYAQSRYLKIQETHLKDSVIRQEIVKLVEARAGADSIFNRGYGYITVDYQVLHNRDTLCRYLLSPNIRRLEKNDYFPPYYTFVNKKLVLLYHLDLSNYLSLDYDLTSRKKLIKLIERFIDPVQKKEEEKIIKDFREAIDKQQGTKPGKNGKNDRVDFIYYGTSTEIFLLKNGNYIVNNNINP